MEVQAALLKYISEELMDNSIELTAEENLLMDGMVSSLGMFRLVGYIEETWQMKIPHEDLVIENFRTVSIISDYIQKRLEEISDTANSASSAAN